MVCLENQQVFSFWIQNLGVSMSGYKSLTHHLLDMWHSLYHHSPKMHWDHSTSISKWNGTWSAFTPVPDGWWALLNVNSHHPFYYILTFGILPPWRCGIFGFSDFDRQPLFSRSCSHCFGTFLPSRMSPLPCLGSQSPDFHAACPSEVLLLLFWWFPCNFLLTRFPSLIFSVRSILLGLFFLLVTNFGNRQAKSFSTSWKKCGTYTCV